MKVDDVIKEKFLNKNSFSIMITKTAEQKEIGCMECLLEYCEENSIDIEDVSDYISDALKEQIEKEAIELNMLKNKKVSLPYE